MSRATWRNAQNRDRPEMGRAQSGFYDTKRGWIDSPRRATCADLPSPGSYPAIAGASIAAGATGSIVYDGTVYQVKNHSRCPVVMGNEVGFHVYQKADGECGTYFIPCTCCGTPSEDCCDKSIAICVNGQTYIIPLDNGRATWAWSPGTCCSDCDGRSWYLVVDTECAGGVVTVFWDLWCVADQYAWTPVANGTLDWSAVCSSSAVQTATIGPSGCELTIKGTTALVGSLCENECGGDDIPTDVGCCDKSLWFCLNSVSVQLPVNGGDHTFNVAECCDECTTATLRIRLQCAGESVLVRWTYICDGGTPASAVENTLMSMFCSSNDPRVININEGCFLQLQVSINDLGCDECGPTATTPPP